MTATGCSGHSSRRRGAVLAMAIAVIGLACVARAHADSAAVDLQVVDRETGQPLKVWRHDGRLFVAGAPGARYGLRVTNHTGGRVQVVMSVDGVNIVSGETASYDQTGYVLYPYQSYDVTGWRKSTSEVAAFTFAPLPQSYAARTGRPADVGVIGMAVYEEKATPIPEPEPEAEVRPDWRDDAAGRSSDRAHAAVEDRATAPPAAVPPPAGANQPQTSTGGVDHRTAGEVQDVTVTAEKRESPKASVPVTISAFTSQKRDVVAAERRVEKLGTAHGPRERSVVTMVNFERSTPYPLSIRQIEYDTYDNLVASGVIPSPRYGEHRSRPFPSSPDGAGFVPDPPSDP